MKKQKPKARKIYHRLTFWLGVLVLGTLVGVSIQFTRAWVEPSSSAPEGNIAAPVNTGASRQVKKGTSSQKADICVDPSGTGDEKCLGDLVTFPACTMAGGMPITLGTTTICKFPGGSCPQNTIVNGATVSWVQYLKYSETTANTCTGSGGCGTSVTTGSHLFNNIDPATEAKTYYNGSQTSYSCCPGGYNCCTYMTYGQNGWWVCAGYECCAWTTCTSCSQTAQTCMPNTTAVGCVPK